MKVGILAGGLGTRLSEETTVKPKPMVEIGGKPILWHIMKTYASYGYKEFVVALGYKGEVLLTPLCPTAPQFHIVRMKFSEWIHAAIIIPYKWYSSIKLGPQFFISSISG